MNAALLKRDAAEEDVARRVPMERLGWRDEKISEWHMTLGYDFPAVDLDFILLEYDAARPAALIEYKHINAKKLQRSHPSFRALCALCDAARLPFFVVRYDHSFETFRVAAMNRFAAFYEAKPHTLTSKQYIELLARLRRDARDRTWRRANG